MAIVSTNLTSGSDTANPGTTASVSPTANALLELLVQTIGFAAPGAATATGCGVTWVEVDHQDFSSIASPSSRLTLLRAMGTPTTGQITITDGGVNPDLMAWVLNQHTGVDTSGTNGSGAVVQSAKNVTDGGTPSVLTVTLAALTDAVNNVTSVCFCNTGNDTTFSDPASYTLLAAASTTGVSMRSTYKLPGTTTPNTTGTVDFEDFAGLAIEIKAASGAANNQLMWVKG